MLVLIAGTSACFVVVGSRVARGHRLAVVVLYSTAVYCALLMALAIAGALADHGHLVTSALSIDSVRSAAAFVGALAVAACLGSALYLTEVALKASTNTVVNDDDVPASQPTRFSRSDEGTLRRVAPLVLLAALLEECVWRGIGSAAIGTGRTGWLILWGATFGVCHATRGSRDVVTKSLLGVTCQLSVIASGSIVIAAGTHLTFQALVSRRLRARLPQPSPLIVMEGAVR
jgi:hypothetical protein